MSRKESGLGNERFAANNGTAECAPLSVHVLGGRVNHSGRAQRKRALQVRCGKAIVDNQRHVVRVRERAQPREIDQFEPWV